MVEPFGGERTYRLVRVALAESAASAYAANAADLDAALTSFDGIDGAGNTDHEQLQDEIKRRFATYIDRERGASDADSATGDGKSGGYQVYTNKAAELAVDQGYAETVLTRAYTKIISATATIGTAPDMAHEYLADDDTPDVDTAALMDVYHTRGGYRRALIRADRLARGLGSSALYVRWHEGAPKYQAVPPQSIFAKFGDRINSGNDVRAVDMTDIDDATCIGIRLPDYVPQAGSQPQIRMLLYCGRSTEYPRGRCCVYTVPSMREWADAPKPGAGERLLEDYTVGNEIANPLTLAQDRLGADVVPTEYPVAIFLGQDSGPDLGLMPTTGLALWRDCMEFDVAYSRVLSAAVEGARGLLAVKNPGNLPLPKNFTGAVALQGGQDASKIGHEAAGAAQAALAVLEAVSNRISNAYSVPAYLMTHDGTTAPQSGYALDVQNMPLEQLRRERIELNRAAVERVYWITRGLCDVHDEDADIPATTDQHWNPGHIDRPVNRTEQITELGLAEEHRLINHVGAVRRYHGFATDDDAINYILASAKQAAKLAEELGDDASLQLSITDAAKFVRVSEARVAAGLPPLVLDDGSPDPDARLTLMQFEAKAAGAAAPQPVGLRGIAAPPPRPKRGGADAKAPQGDGKEEEGDGAEKA